jgi:two-component system, NtrC family, sensor histidine kinase HydH
VLSEGAHGASGPVIDTWSRFRRDEVPPQSHVAHVSELREARPLLEAEGFRWTATVPLSSGGQPVAMFSLGRKSGSRYTAAELRTAETLGVHITSLLERTRLYNQLSQRLRHLSLLYELAQTGTTMREVQPLIDRLLALLLDHIPCDSASILYARGNELQLGGYKPRPGSGLPETIALAHLPFDDASITGSTLRSLKTTRVSLDEAPARTRKEMEAFGAKHLMAAPLVVGDRHFGALLVSRLQELPFTEDDVKLMESCAAQVSVLVEHVKLFDDLRQSYSHLERAQAEVVRHERLAALGELAAVMAHEVRNPLGVIFNSLTSLKKKVSHEPEAALLLSIVGEEADRLNRIVGDLLDFARPYDAERAPIELEPVVASAVEAATQAVSAQVKVVTEFAPQLPRFVIDGHLVRQALVNLVMNAIQAMPKGGKVTVRVGAHQKNGQSLARIEVCDEGVGISPQTEKHIFQPFFTTKATGTGLGLAVVKRIVDAHHGEISVRSAMGGGSTFTMMLPSGP